MNKQEIVSVRVRDLRIGDVTTGSKNKILRMPYTSTRCPAGRLWVEVERVSGTKTTMLWGANTTIKVVRSS